MIQFAALCLFDTGAGPSVILKSIVPLSWRHRTQRLKVPRFQTASKNQVEIERLVPLQVYIKDLEVRV